MIQQHIRYRAYCCYIHGSLVGVTKIPSGRKRSPTFSLSLSVSLSLSLSVSLSVSLLSLSLSFSFFLFLSVFLYRSTSLHFYHIATLLPVPFHLSLISI